MAKRDEYEAKTEALLEPIMEANNYELVDVEYVKEGATWYLRAYIDKEEGINIDDCELVSRALSEILDQDDFIDDAYILEVSSPGLGRQLKKDKHFARCIGDEVEIKLYKAINKQKDFVGILDSFTSETLTIVLDDDTKMEIARTDIAMVRLTLDF